MPGELKLEDIDIDLYIHPEHIEISQELDEQTVAGIEQQLESGNEWAWCCVEVRGSFGGLVSSDCLGCCSYQSEEDFKRDLYYEDMCQTVLQDLQKKLDWIIEWTGEKIKSRGSNFELSESIG